MSESNSRVCVDLCRGLGGFSQAFVDAGWKVIGVDIEPKFNPTVCADITKIDWLQFKHDFLDDKSPDVLLASPPCERFSIACRMFPKVGVKKALEIVGAVYEAIAVLRPRNWIVENPRGRLRWFLGKPNSTIALSNYGLRYKKPTDLWHNFALPLVRAEKPYELSWSWNKFTKRKEGGFLHGPRDPAKRAVLPYGLSQAVLEAVS